MESGDVSEPRMARITRAIFSSRYSIHDLSRCVGQGDQNLARFNMPLELGIAMAKRYLDPAAEHDWLVLVPAGHSYSRFISDLGAFDPATHDGSVEKIVSAVMAWLLTRKDAIADVTPQLVLSKLPEFLTRKKILDDAWGGHPPWADTVLLAIRNLAKHSTVRPLNQFFIHCLITVPSRRRISPHPPFNRFRSPSSKLPNGYLAAAFSSTSMPQPGASLGYQ